MSRKRRRQISVQTPQTQPSQTLNRPDARREIAARASKALRSAEVAKLQNTLVQVYKQEVFREQVRTHKHRPVTRQGVQESTNRRYLPSSVELRRQELSPKVRNFLQDGIRALACARRRTRKEVIHALRRTGKAGARNKKARWTEKSYLRCK